MNKPITIIENDKSFTPFYFYSNFLDKLANFYSTNKEKHELVFQLFEGGDNSVFDSNYIIDPIATPLLLSVIEQLSAYHKNPITTILHNNHATKNALSFLYFANFFSVTKNELLKFEDIYLGDFWGKEIKKNHIIHSYKKSDYPNINFRSGEDITLRDDVNSLTAYKVRDHFEDLLFENEKTSDMSNVYIAILSELITNGIIHSNATTYAMMFVNRFSTKFSISDNGIGFKASLNNKSNLPIFYTKNEFENSIKSIPHDFPEIFINNLIEIFEILFFSSLKSRKGLFDLMLNVVIKSNGYFRIHTDNCQIIFSNRIFKSLVSLLSFRSEILSIHRQYELCSIDEPKWNNKLQEQKKLIIDEFLKLFNNTLGYYSNESQYSSIRFFNVKFKGVHIEVEIPN